jgi:hypothetical protein
MPVERPGVAPGGSPLLRCWPGAALALVLSTGCSSGPEESEYYEAYLQLEAEVDDMGARLDSTLIRIRDLEAAVTAARAELEAAQAAATEAQLAAPRDPPSAEFHAQNALENIRAAAARLAEVQP